MFPSRFPLDMLEHNAVDALAMICSSPASHPHLILT